MKKWTIVIEVTDRNTHEEYSYNRSTLESDISDALEGRMDLDTSFQIMEIIEAPYGPQHPNGVFLDDRHNIGRCICRPGGKYIKTGCKAKVHRQ